ncbi:hypothetical protein L6164_029792 [Bauhinia variegata]|uniref:Uncharacterized protein n=1 Tax=Bauhinia variegata TaxID=167791 RepID=A0ACB9L9T8_BAUVA|nr:hypothetical protein L6164_029792 [Bauhinia variegata]
MAFRILRHGLLEKFCYCIQNKFTTTYLPFLAIACASPIPAHKAVLATSSEIFKIMLDSDECKVAPSKTITLSEVKYEELECLWEFLYSGTLAPEKVEKHKLQETTLNFLVENIRDIASSSRFEAFVLKLPRPCTGNSSK